MPGTPLSEVDDDDDDGARGARLQTFAVARCDKFEEEEIQEDKKTSGIDDAEESKTNEQNGDEESAILFTNEQLASGTTVTSKRQASGAFSSRKKVRRADTGRGNTNEGETTSGTDGTEDDVKDQPAEIDLVRDKILVQPDKAKFDALLIDRMNEGLQDLGETHDIRVLAQEQEPELAATNPRAAAFRVLTRILIDRAKQASKVKENIGHVQDLLCNNFDTNGMSVDEKETLLNCHKALLHDLSIALGMTPGDLTNVELGNLFIKQAYEKGLGWYAVPDADKQTKLLVNKGLHLCGFDVAYILNTHDRKNYYKNEIPRRNNKDLSTRVLSSMIGTSVVLVHSAMREITTSELPYVQKRSQYKAMRNVPSIKVALLIMGMYVKDHLNDEKNRIDIVNRWYNKVTEEISWPRQGLRKSFMDTMPSYDVIRSRVRYMLDELLAAEGGFLNVRHACAWIDKPAPVAEQADNRNQDKEESHVAPEDVKKAKEATRNYVGCAKS